MTDYDNCELLFTHHYVTENGVNSNVFVQLQVIKKKE